MSMLSKFEVIEVVKHVPPMSLIIEPTKLRQTRGIVEALEYAPYVRYLLDGSTKRLAIQVTTAKDPQKVAFSKEPQEQKALAVLYQNATLVGTIRGLMPEWDPAKKYKVPGTYSKADKAIIFDLKKGVQYARGERKKKGQAGLEDGED